LSKAIEVVCLQPDSQYRQTNSNQTTPSVDGNGVHSGTP